MLLRFLTTLGCGLSVKASNLFGKLLHPFVGLSNNVRALLQFVNHAVRHLAAGFVVDLMLQAGPEVHRDGSQLHFHPHHLFSVGEKDRNLQHQMVAAVAVGLGVFDVVLFFDDYQIVLTGQHLSHGVDVLDEGADDPDARNVVEVGAHGIQGNREALAVHLFDNAHRALDAALDRVDGVVPLSKTGVPLQNFQLGADLLNARLV